METKYKIKFAMNAVGSLDVDISKFLHSSVDNENYRQYIGYNSGNLVINEYFKRSIDNFEEVSEFIESDKVIFICANFLRPNCLKEWPAKFSTNFLKKTDKDIIVFGVGAQATLENMNVKEYAKLLDDDLIAYMHLLSDKTNIIGVRGEFTYDVCRAIGIKNVELIGCPTWFVNGYNQPEIVKKDWSNSLKPAFYACWEPYSSWHQDWHKKMLQESLSLFDPKFIIQSEFDFLPYHIFNTNCLSFLQNSNIDEYQKSLKYIHKYFDLTYWELLTNNKLRNLFKFFVDIDKWEKFIKTRDFTYGMRIHGSVVALKNGVPAIPVVSDSRILEMCELFKIPYIRVDKISSSDFNLQEIYEKSDFSDMNKIYLKLLENYISFLEKNGLKCKFEKTSIVRN